MSITLCIALRNEIPNIQRVIQSTYDWVDEIVIVDGESTDGTVAWLEKQGPKIRIIHTKNDPMFHRMKQRALDEAQSDWILQLDADEEIPQALRQEILQILAKDKEDTLTAYQIARKNYFLGRFLMKGGVYPDYTIRLYKRGKMYFPCKDLHENVEPVDRTTQIKSTLGYLVQPMNHYSDPTWSRYFVRWQRYCRAEALRAKTSHLDISDTKERFLIKTQYLVSGVTYKPLWSFFMTYIRHKGCMDGWQGLLFHSMSALRWIGAAYYYMRLPIA